MWQKSAVIVECLIRGIDTCVSVEPTACAKMTQFRLSMWICQTVSVFPCWRLTTQTIINYTYRSLFVQWHEDDFSKVKIMCEKGENWKEKLHQRTPNLCCHRLCGVESITQIDKTSFFAARTSRCTYHDVVAQIAALHWRRRWPQELVSTRGFRPFVWLARRRSKHVETTLAILPAVSSVPRN